MIFIFLIRQKSALNQRSGIILEVQIQIFGPSSKVFIFKIWIWTSKIMPELWLSAVFCQIKKKSLHPIAPMPLLYLSHEALYVTETVLKVAVSRDFLAIFYFMNQTHLGP